MSRQSLPLDESCVIPTVSFRSRENMPHAHSESYPGGRVSHTRDILECEERPDCLIGRNGGAGRPVFPARWSDRTKFWGEVELDDPEIFRGGGRFFFKLHFVYPDFENKQFDIATHPPSLRTSAGPFHSNFNVQRIRLSRSCFQ